LGKEGCDFISANFVSGEVPSSERAYIATQGPLQTTQEDFWRMVFECNVMVIVMLANEIENGKEKVFAYWPEQTNTPLQLELFQVNCLDITKTDQVVTRHFAIREAKSGAVKNVAHFQYIAWPDQGLPMNTDGMNSIMEMTDAVNTTGAPIVVHCSAGIGRTGVFCVVHSVLAKMKLLLTSNLQHPDINIKKIVLHMREQRAGMVQTPEQYAFCYLTLLEQVPDIWRIIDYKNEKWYHKNLDSNQANLMLQNKPHGTFFFRSSSVPGFLVLSAVSGKNSLNARIGVSINGFELEKDSFISLTALVESRKTVLIHPLLRQQ